MAACSFCYATLNDGAEACPRCGRAVGSRAPVADGPTLPTWTERPAPTPAAPATPAPAAPAAPPATPTPPARPPGAPWQAPDATGAVPTSTWPPPPGPAAPPPGPPAPAPPWTAPAAAPPPGGWPATPPARPNAFPGAVPVAPDGEDLDRSNAIVLVVISAIVALGLVVIAVLASNGIGPSLDELDGASARPHPVEVASAAPGAEADGGR